MAKPIPYDDDNEDEGSDERDMRKLVIYDDEALKLMQGWTGGQSDPLYAISSTGGWNYAWVFSDAISNIDRDLHSVKKIGRNKFQLGKGTFSKAEIDELRYIRDALQMTLDDPESVMVDEARGGHVRAPRGGATEFKHLLFGTRFTFIDPTREGHGAEREGWAYVKTGHNTYRNPLSPSGRKYEHRISNPNAMVVPEHETVNESRTVRDYEAVDNRDRHIAGPFKSYGDARQAAGTAGVVKFVPSRGKPSRATEVRERKEAPLPRHLYNAYEWITSASEWDDALSSPEEYARDAAANAAEHGQSNITKSDLLEVIEWFTAQRRGSRATESRNPSRSAHHPTSRRR